MREQLISVSVHSTDPEGVCFNKYSNVEGVGSFVALRIGGDIRITIQRDETDVLAALEAACAEAREWLESQPAPAPVSAADEEVFF